MERYKAGVHAMVRHAIAAIAATFATASSAQLVDGGFETQGVSAGGGYCYLMGNCGAGAWVGAGSGFINENNADWPGVQTTGTYHAFVQGGGVLAQIFTNQTAGRYKLTWTDAGRSRPGYDGDHTYTAFVDDTPTTFKTSYTTTTSPSTSFTARGTGSFYLNANTLYQVRFLGTNSGDTTSFIDDVALTAVTGVPEPTQWALMIGGFGFAGLAARRRRTLAAA
jgi:hypothetical protein